MRELFDLSEKYGFTAPLVSAPDNLDLKVYLRLCGALSISPTTVAVVSDIFIALQDIDERIASFDFLAERIDRKVSNIRHHLVLLEKTNLVTSEFITTDPIRRRRGKLYSLAIPKGQDIATTKSDPADDDVSNYQMVASSTVETINIDRYDDKTRFLELQIVRYLVKAMRTNRKDKAGTIRVKLKEEGRAKPISITARAEEGRLIYLPDMSYYAGAMAYQSYLRAHRRGGYHRRNLYPAT